jgi:hypothetical protein
MTTLPLKTLPVLLLLMFLLQGCIVLPIPSKEASSPQVSGRILDGGTKEPVPSALVCFEGRAKTFVQTDEAGRFELKRQTDFALFTIFFVDDHWHVPHPRPFPRTVLVRSAGHQMAAIDLIPYYNKARDDYCESARHPGSPHSDPDVLDLGNIEVRPQGGANRSQPFGSDMDRTSAAAASRRSP